MQIPSKDKMEYRKSTRAYVVNNNDEFLVVQSVRYGEGFWEFPGGGVKKNETAEETIIRELKEETGTDSYEIIAKSFIKERYDWEIASAESIYKRTGKWLRGQEKIQFLVKFLGTNADININKEELDDFKWIKFNEFEKYLVFEGQLETALKTIEDFRKSGHLNF